MTMTGIMTALFFAGVSYGMIICEIIHGVLERRNKKQQRLTAKQI